MSLAFRLRSRHAAFTLIELLSVIAVIGILAAILIPAVNGVQERARRAVAQDKLRRIHAAYLAYSTDGTRLRMLAADSAHDWARLLAQETGFNNPEHFILPDDPLVARREHWPTVIATPPASGAGNWILHPDFSAFPLSFEVVSQLPPQAPPSTPIAWTRGLSSAGTWSDGVETNSGIYGSDGGHVLLLDGSIRFYRDLNENGGQLLHYQTRQPTGNIRDAIGPQARILSSTGSAR